MKFVDALILARTKRKTRRIRTALVVVVSSLLFAVLFGAAFMAQGVINAGGQVAEVGFNSRTLTTVIKVGDFEDFDYAAQSKAIVNVMLDELRARKVAVGDRTKEDPAFQAELHRRIGQLEAVRQAEIQKETEKQILAMGKPTDVYHFSPLPLTNFAQYQADPKIDPLAESIKKELAKGDTKQIYFGPTSDQIEFYTAEGGMMRTQVYPGQSLGWQPGRPYPLVVSYGYLEKLAGISLANLPAAERNQGYRDLIKRYAGQELAYCYRNATAQEQLRSVMVYNKAAENDKDASTKPLTVPVCEGFDQKALKKLQIISDDDPTGTKPLFPLPVTPLPDTAVLGFKIAGFVPAVPEFGSGDVIADMLVGIGSLPTGPNPGIVPAEVAAKDSRLQAVAREGGTFLGNAALFLDFATRAEQKAFLDKGCSGGDCVGGGKFFMAPFGNIAMALEGLFKFVSKALFITAAVIMVIAGLMIMLTISKVIADSTKEIAVFRSLGARRRDIAQIYYTYGMMLAASALVIAVFLAVAGALLMTSLYEEKIAQGLTQAAGAYNSEIKVVLLGINPQWLLGITAALAAAATLGIAVPVLASVRRKLINILREE